MIPLAAIPFVPLPAWAAMWTLAFAVFFACKWLTWVNEVPGGCRRRLGLRGGSVISVAYFFAWPGMDPTIFLRRSGAGRRIDTPFLGPAVRITVGIVLVWLAVPRVRVEHPLLAGWVGMTGLILMLHFGAFDVLSAAWRARGVDAKPLMNAPTRATSLADFWGNRWNTAFNHLSRRYCFAPLRRPLGLAGATLATFLASGVIHDLVISVPARGGYGLPTLYFIIQGLGVLLERTPVARRAGLRRGLPGRAYAALFLLAPLPWLFHVPFVTRVILPLLEVLR
jgi:hypothetical protein